MALDERNIGLVKKLTKRWHRSIIIALCLRVISQCNRLLVTTSYLTGCPHINFRESANTDTFFGTVECVAQEETFVARST